ncbi:hypothetical protein Tco_1496539 [Tanacetum coccineum]
MGFGIVGVVRCIDYEYYQQRISDLASAVVAVHHGGYLVVVVAVGLACKPPPKPHTGTQSPPFRAHCNIVSVVAGIAVLAC